MGSPSRPMHRLLDSVISPLLLPLPFIYKYTGDIIIAVPDGKNPRLFAVFQQI